MMTIPSKWHAPVMFFRDCIMETMAMILNYYLGVRPGHCKWVATCNNHLKTSEVPKLSTPVAMIYPLAIKHGWKISHLGRWLFWWSFTSLYQRLPPIAARRPVEPAEKPVHPPKSSMGDLQDPTDGGTLVPYYWPYFVGIFPYIGLRNGPYIW